VNVSSRAAQRASRGLSAYSASKGALEALTRSIAVDHAEHSIRCNTVSPGFVLNERRDADVSDERRRQLEAMHLTRLGQPLDVAYAALYLASREAEFVTGIVLPVDGGSSTTRAPMLAVLDDLAALLAHPVCPTSRVATLLGRHCSENLSSARPRRTASTVSSGVIPVVSNTFAS